MGMQLPMPLQTLLYGLRPIEYLSWCQRRYGDVFTVRLPFGPTTMLADPADIREVFALRADDLRRPDSAPFIEPFVGQRSLVLLGGDRHREERRVIIQAFHGESMAAYEAAMVEATRRDIATWPTDR